MEAFSVLSGMDLRNAPILLPAAALAAGAFLAFQLTYLSVPLLALLAALGLAAGRRAGVGFAFLAAGALAATVAAGLPARALAAIDLARPAEAAVRVVGHWARDREGWSAPVEVERLRQGLSVTTPRLAAVLLLPGEEAPPPYGSLLHAAGYLRRSPGFANRVAVAPGPWRLRVKSRLLMGVEEDPGLVARLSGSLRQRVEAAYAAAGTETAGKALARALVLGDPSALPLPWKRGLRRDGLAHLIAVSGLHVGMVAALAFLLGGWLPRRARLALAIAAVACYLLLVGPHPALVRAAVMGILGASSLFFERPPAAVNALGWAVVLLVLGRPDVVLLPAFQLSAAASAGVLLLAPALSRRWRRLPRWLRRPLALSTAAQLAALPASLPLFHLVAPWAPFANLFAVPWTALALAAAFAWTAAALASPRLGALLLPALDLLAAPFAWPAHTGPAGWCLPLLASPLAALLLAAGIATLLLRGRRGLGIALPLLAVAVWGLGPPADRGPRSERSGRSGLELAMLDVGQGDAILVRDGERAVLVDGGGWDGADFGGRVLLPALLGEGVRRLDALVMTHPDRDHCGGLVDVAAYLPVAEVWTAPGWEREGCAGEFLALPGTRRRFLAAGDRVRVGRWRIAVLQPAAKADPGERSNERSLVLQAEALGRRVLLTGDAEAREERRALAAAGEDGLHADLLKVGHHGSKTSSTAGFLDAVAPRLALLSVGIDNPYHHPSPVVVKRLAERGVRTLRTDRDGEVLLRIVHVDGLPGVGRLRLSLPGAPR